MRHLKRLGPYLRRYRRNYRVGTILLLLGSVCAMAAPLLLRDAVDRLEFETTRDALLWPCVGLVILALLRGIFAFFGRSAIILTARNIEFDMRNDLFGHLQRLGPSFFARHPAGDLTSRVINDLEGIRMLIGAGVMALVGTTLTTMLGVAMMFLLHPTLAAFAMAPLVGIALIYALTNHALHVRSLAVQDQLGVISSRAQENLAGQRIVRAYAQEEAEIARFDAASRDYLRCQMSVVGLRGLVWALLAVFAELGIGLTLWLGGRGIVAGTFSPGELLAFTAYQFMLVWPMIALGWFVGLLQRGGACAQRLSEVWDARPDVEDGAAADGSLPDVPPIEIRGLTFSYGGPDVLQDVSLRVPAGGLVAVVGRTGSGKSTLAGLLTRLLPTPRGTVFVAGRDICDLPLAALRERIATVPQDNFLFSDTLRANIAFGARNGVAPEDVERAAGLSMLDRDVEQFPQRYDSLIGERGVMLSGGQRQRTCLARAVIRSPSVLVLDDCLSSVDVETEGEILRRLRGFLAGRTCVMITHRLAGCRAANRIYVLDEGRIAEEGAHDELISRRGIYARLWEQQRLQREIESL